MKKYIIFILSSFFLQTHALLAMENPQPKKIYLAIDSGGALGIGPATLLKQLEQDTGNKATDIFAGFAGTSTGGIITALLAAGYSANDTYNFYHQHANEIFGGGNFFLIPQCHVALSRLLEEKFAAKKISSTLKPLLILTTAEGKVIEFDSDKAKNPQHDTTIKEAVRATASIPMIWPAAEVKLGDQKILCTDAGCMGINDPTYYLYEKLKKEAYEGDIVIYSLGTGYQKASSQTKQLIANNENSKIKVIRLEPNLEKLPGYNPDNILAHNLFAAITSPEQFERLEARARDLINSDEYALLVVDASANPSAENLDAILDSALEELGH